MVPGVTARLDRRLDDVSRRGEIRLAGTEADDGLTGGLERLGLGIDGQRGRRGDGLDSTGDTAGFRHWGPPGHAGVGQERF